MAATIQETCYHKYEELREAATDLLMRYLRHQARKKPFLVLLPGGNTPRPIYERVAREPVELDPNLHIAVTDERHVSPSDPQSNIGTLLPMLEALGLPEKGRLCVHPARPLREAADLYDEQLDHFTTSGGALELALLGLGADGHTCSLFTSEDLERGQDRWAIPVEREGGMNRISVTQKLLARAHRIVFLAAGEDKRDIAGRLVHDPESIIAGRAVAGADRVELWRC